VKLAIAGKGGSGKTTIAGTLARLAARRGVDVVAIDADLNPNLALILGVEPGAVDRVIPLPDDVAEHRKVDGAHVVELIRPVEDLVLEYGVDCPDKVRLLLMGRPHRAGMGCMCGNHATVRGVLNQLPADGSLVVVDLEASPEHLTRSTPEGAHLLLIVAEAWFRSLETARRYAVLARDLGIGRVAVVANKVRGADEAQVVEAFCDRHGMEVLGAIPYDEGLGVAERMGMAPIDHDPTGPAVAATDRLVDSVLASAPR
jgi:CO dehydrogenase maturation factor